ncbi:uncharacterized protein N7482_010713 [Penicillium canariense]|uniref:chitinase n=1 Tax=Penicillium canariense TaxID=189055 RepID=A0A9W9LD78_9EURO|nr:uncharacterized protein N7482_010713 [Penicillium canariense]KAJ5151461.1 hypothetical protein N7482_010713 [Penicillium canariense]
MLTRLLFLVLALCSFLQLTFTLARVTAELETNFAVPTVWLAVTSRRNAMLTGLARMTPAVLLPDSVASGQTENCVAGCDNKAYCDPGGYGEFAEHAKCPLNVCCSKWGYCGMTSEFCGDKKVKRPSASYSPSTPLYTIVGYYEGWSHERPCHSFFPEQIPLGIYTVERPLHLNYAFGAIDPDTFEVKLASTEEEDLIKRLARLKTQDPDLKVFIALGGWSYNDPGPTRSTFSNLATSKDAQKKFFKSLISFLSTYNLDGVDLDWEYPGPDDIVERGGREEDFANFPTFLRALKEALKSAGGRDGLTVTLPASYWFLQHFDIVEMEKHVDFFNIMTYDLHGAWDRGNKWLGPYLLAHTNLTEIQDAMDLLWRNEIPSKKVVMGTAFYGRAFTATSTSCMEPGCTFESAGNKGPCSRENGILLNSEIMDIIDDRGLTPTLYKEAGVKVAHWDDQWVAYDDEETLQLKVDYALGLNLGGVMVWAVSHDTPTRQFSNAFYARAANRHGMILKEIDDNHHDQVQIKKTIDQCKWTNCGDGCPNGYQPATRIDGNKHNVGELMMDSTACENELHILCCPETSMPTCGWYKHSNSFCDYTCPDGTVEVGSTNGGCHSGYQAACCSVGTSDKKMPSMDVYDSCVWAGEASDCNADCPILKKYEQLSSAEGSGAVKCKPDQERKYCCYDDDDNKWTGGDWYKFENMFVQFVDDPLRCSSDCPGNMYRLAMERTGVCKNKPGAMSYCALNSRYDTEWKEQQNVTDLKDALGHFFQSPTCPNQDSGGLSTRDVSDSQARTQARTVLISILSAAYYNSDLIADYISYWNLKIQDYYSNLQFPGFRDDLNDWSGNIYSLDIENLADDILCNLEAYDDLASSSPVLSCSATNECADADSDCANAEWDETCSDFSTIEKRVGASRLYCFVYDDQTGGEGDTAMHSSQYQTVSEPSRNSDVRLRVIIYRDLADCANTEVQMVFLPSGNTYNGRPVHMEHIMEMNTEGRFLSDITYGRLDETSINAYTPVPAGFVSDAWINGPNINPATWGPPIGGGQSLTNSWWPSVRIFEAYGSLRNQDNFFILDAYLNFLKNRVWMWRRWNRGPLADSSMTTYVNDMTNPDRALTRMRSVITIFRYLNAEEVRRALRAQYREIGAERWIANQAWNLANPTQTFDIRPIWIAWFRNHVNGMITTSTSFLNRWLDDMETNWQGQTGPLAVRVLGDIERLRVQIRNGAVNIRIDDF